MTDNTMLAEPMAAEDLEPTVRISPELTCGVPTCIVCSEEDAAIPASSRTRRKAAGLVAKDPESRYVGGRTLKWLKTKQPCYRESERGWKPTGKSWSTRPAPWCRFDPLAVPPRPS